MRVCFVDAGHPGVGVAKMGQVDMAAADLANYGTGHSENSWVAFGNLDVSGYEDVARMTATDTTETDLDGPPATPPESTASEASPSKRGLNIAIRVAPYAVIWTTLLLPTIRTMARGWRPLGDDASEAIQAWNTFSLHPALVGQGTGAAVGIGGIQNTADPGPLEFWLQGPFVHLDPGQGLLLGAAVLGAAVLTFAVYVLGKSAGPWAAVIFALVIVDLAIVSPTPFVDPAWGPAFALIWFLAFLAVAFAVGLGNWRYVPCLVFIGSVTIDTHLMFLPSVGLVLLTTLICAWLLARPQNFRWLWWTIGVALVCWIAPISQQLLASQPNGTRLLQGLTTSKTHTFGTLLGLRALSRAASPSAVWATARPIGPFGAYNDIVHNGNLLFCLALVALVAVVVVAWRRRSNYLFSLAAITTASAIGLVALFSRVPSNYILSFIWINEAVWVVGICIWLTFGLGAVTWARSTIRRRNELHISKRAVQVVALVVLTAGALVATAVVAFPYGGRGFQLDFRGDKRVQGMAAIVEENVSPGHVGLEIHYSGKNYLQYISDEHGVAYLLETAGWVPGMSQQVSGLLNLPIDRGSPLVVFNEEGASVTGFARYGHYEQNWYFTSGA